VINYAIALTNDGNMTLTNPMVSDNFASDLAPVMAGTSNVGDTDHDGKLGLGETWQYTADHTVTQAEIDNGSAVVPGLSFSNTATAATDQGASATASASVLIAQNPSLTLAKAGTFNDANGDGLRESGRDDQLHLHGNQLRQHDPQGRDGERTREAASPRAARRSPRCRRASRTAPPTPPPSRLRRPTSDGRLQGQQGGGDQRPMRPSAPATAHVDLPQNPQMTLTESASTSSSTPSAGDSLVYSFSLTNDGNVTLHGPTVGDTATTGVNVALERTKYCRRREQTISCSDVGETWTFAGTRTLTAADIANGVCRTWRTRPALGPQDQMASATSSLIFIVEEVRGSSRRDRAAAQAGFTSQHTRVGKDAPVSHAGPCKRWSIFPIWLNHGAHGFCLIGTRSVAESNLNS